MGICHFACFSQFSSDRKYKHFGPLCKFKQSSKRYQNIIAVVSCGLGLFKEVKNKKWIPKR